MNADKDHAAAITAWLIGPARTRLSPGDILAGLVERLQQAGIRLLRVRMGQSLANPMISAWGVVWTREGGVEHYTIKRSVLSTPSYYGSPFEAVISTRKSYRHSLEKLDASRHHAVLLEQAAAGGTDYFAIPVEYGDNLFQVSAFTTDRPGGFDNGDIALIEALGPAMAAAFEPAALRHSTLSLLEVYLGTGPARRVAKGEFQRGQTSRIDAAIVMCDLRDFTGQSERLAPEDLLERLGAYFEIVVDAMRAEDGDVLKFVGDGVLTVFPADDGDIGEASRRAGRAIARAFAGSGTEGPAFVAAAHTGQVVYGNIGSLDRLDFTVVGSTVNYVSRLEGLAKQLGVRAICSEELAQMLPSGDTRSLGMQTLKGFADPHPVFELVVDEVAPGRNDPDAR